MYFLLLLLVMSHGHRLYAERSYYGMEWKTLTFKTAIENRRNSPTSMSARCACSTPGTLVLNKREISTVYIVDGDNLKTIGLPGQKPDNWSLRVDMSLYTSVVLLNGDDYAIYGEARDVSRVDPWGLWVVR